MPTGSLTVTPGKVFSPATEEVDHTKLNLLAQPTMAVPANAVGLRELRAVTDLSTAVGDAAVVRNLFANPMLDRDIIRTTTAATCAVGLRTQVSPGWLTAPSGAAVTAQHGAFTVAGAVPAAAMIVTGDTSVTTVDHGQYLPPHLCQRLSGEQITITFAIQNNTGASLTPLLRIDTSDTAADRATVTNEVSEAAASALADGAVGDRSWTVDLSTLNNWENGAWIWVRLPSGALSAGSKSVRIGGARLEPGAEAAAWQHYPDKGTHTSRWLRRHALHQTTVPGPTNDATEGWSVGSVWGHSNGDRYQCTTATKDRAVWVKLGDRTQHYVFARYSRASGTNGGDTATAGANAWPAEAMTEVTDTTAAVTIGASITVGSPTYWRVRAVQTLFDSGVSLMSVRVRFDGGATRTYSANLLTTDGNTDLVHLKGIFPINYAGTQLEMFIEVASAKAGSGHGLAGSFGTEVYGFVELTEVAIPSLGRNTIPAHSDNGHMRVKLAITEPITILDFIANTVQGIALGADDLVLITGQEDPAENGIFKYEPTNTRFVSQYGKQYSLCEIDGGLHANAVYLQTLPVTTVGTNAQHWVRIAAPVLNVIEV